MSEEQPNKNRRMKRYPEGDPRNRRQWKPWYKRYWIIRGRRREDKIARYIVLVGTALALLPFVYVMAGPAQTPTAYLPVVIGGQLNLADEVLSRVNAARQEAGCPPLTTNLQLQQAAHDWSEYMADNDIFAHRNLSELRGVYGYNGAIAGENIAAGYETPDTVVTGWLNSPGHRANILNCRYTDSGIGYTIVDPDGGKLRYGVYWTQNFGANPGDGPSLQSVEGEEWDAPEGLVDLTVPTQEPAPDGQ